ncbi:MAG: hypothetical protein ACYDEA_08985 [Candidatus Dormibacteria bacterium]
MAVPLAGGTGAQGELPVRDGVRSEADRRRVEFLSMPTAEAIAILNVGAKDTNAILHLTC